MQTETGPKLIQFRCKNGGELFYFQGYLKLVFLWKKNIRCPFCGSKRVQATGREYPLINERDSTAFPKE